MGSSTDTCVFNRCAIEFGEVCNDSASGDSSCVSAQCMDFVTQTLVQGMHCSYLYAEHGDSVVCDDTGHVVSEETCSEEAPCNACGACGPTPEEVCDGKDNDCDGETDEGVLNACGECGEQPSKPVTASITTATVTSMRDALFMARTRNPPPRSRLRTYPRMLKTICPWISTPRWRPHHPMGRPLPRRLTCPMVPRRIASRKAARQPTSRVSPCYLSWLS